MHFIQYKRNKSMSNWNRLEKMVTQQFVMVQTIDEDGHLGCDNTEAICLLTSLRKRKK